MKRFLLCAHAALLLLFLFAAPARAQDLGNVGLRTVDTVLATNVNCTGGTQDFITGPTTNFNNLGQTQHYVTVVGFGAPTSLTAEIDGIDAAGNVFRISDQVHLPVGFTNASLAGNGRFPKIRVRITCTPNTSTFTASYSGTFTSAAPSVGSYQIGQIDKGDLFQIAANGNSADSFQTPFGNSSGTMYAQYSGGSLAGSTITWTCSSLFMSGLSGSFSLANVTTQQIFQLPASTCPFLAMSYNSGGATAASISLETVFNIPGNVLGTDPCQSPGIPKSSAVVTAPAASTTQIVTPTAGKVVYPCGWDISQATAIGTFQFISGTGATCGTVTQNMTGAFLTTLGIPNSYGGAASSIAPQPIGSGVCIVTAGAAANAAGVFTFVQL